MNASKTMQYSMQVGMETRFRSVGRLQQGPSLTRKQAAVLQYHDPSLTPLGLYYYANHKWPSTGFPKFFEHLAEMLMSFHATFRKGMRARNVSMVGNPEDYLVHTPVSGPQPTHRYLMPVLV
jgi:hypothetical protein